MELLVEGCERVKLSPESGYGEDEGGDSEVVGSWSLLESAPRHKDYPCVLEDFEAIEEID